MFDDEYEYRDYWVLLNDEDDRVENLEESRNYEIFEEELEFEEYEEENIYAIYNTGISGNDFAKDIFSILLSYEPSFEFSYSKPNVFDWDEEEDFKYLGTSYIINGFGQEFRGFSFDAFPMTKEDLIELKGILLEEIDIVTNELGYEQIEEKILLNKRYRHFFIFGETVLFIISPYGELEEFDINNFTELIDNLKSYDKIINLKDMINFYLD